MVLSQIIQKFGKAIGDAPNLKKFSIKISVYLSLQNIGMRVN